MKTSFTGNTRHACIPLLPVGWLYYGLGDRKLSDLQTTPSDREACARYVDASWNFDGWIGALPGSHYAVRERSQLAHKVWPAENPWITDRSPTRDDADGLGYVYLWEESYGTPRAVFRQWALVRTAGTPWCPTGRPTLPPPEHVATPSRALEDDVLIADALLGCHPWSSRRDLAREVLRLERERVNA